MLCDVLRDKSQFKLYQVHVDTGKMDKVFLGLLFVLNVVFLVQSQYPPGFIIYPIYNQTNITNPNVNVNGGPCQYTNNPEPFSHSLYKGCVSVYDRLIYNQVRFLL